jgi:thiol:disulfide interchange protein
MRKNASILLTLLGISMMAFVFYGLYQSVPGRLGWESDYEDALGEAQSRDQLVLAYLYTDWCGYCKKMDAETFRDSDLIDEMSDNYVWLRLNAETQEDGVRLQRKFGITAYPCTVIMDQTGAELDRIEGFVPVGRFREAVKNASKARNVASREVCDSATGCA